MEVGDIIYIPICLYLNSNCNQRLLTDISIYIPICLYLNKSCNLKAVPNILFTFQYVSI